MARRIDGIIKRPTDKIQSIGVGLRLSEIEMLETIGIELGDHLESEPVARNALMRIAIRRFLDAYDNKELTLNDIAAYFDIPDKPKPKLRF